MARSRGYGEGAGDRAPVPLCPQAAKNDPELYALLSLIDALRVGGVREQRLAEGELEKRICTP